MLKRLTSVIINIILISMKRSLLLHILLFVLLSNACVVKEKEIEHIVRLENTRITCDSLSTFLKSPEPRIRARAVEALGKLQDNSCLQTLVDMLKDPDENVRLETVFALGQIGISDLAEAALITKLNSIEENEVNIRIIEALGKIGTERTFPILIRLFKSENANLRAEAALSAGRMASRKITNQSMTTSLTSLLEDKNDDVRWKACYSLMQAGKDLDIKSLRKAIDDPDPRVRKYAIQSLGKLQDLAVIESLARILRKEKDWRVRVKVANALGNYPLYLVADYFSFLNQESHIRRTIIQAIGACALQEPKRYRKNSREHNLAKHQLEQILTYQLNNDNAYMNKWTLSEIKTTLNSYARLMGKQSIEMISKFTHNEDKFIQASANAALGETGSNQVLRILEKNYTNAPTTVKIAILEAYTKIGKPTNPRLYLNALRENDHVLVALAVKGLSQDTLNSKIYTLPVIEAYQKLPKPVDVESAKIIFQAMMKIGDKRLLPVLKEALKIPDKALSIVVAKVLEKISKEDYSAQITSFTQPHQDFQYRDIQRLEGSKAFIKTTRGNIEIKLFTEDAPLTVLNFVQLAEKGFYDRLTFHRVVPDFVIQGGDPRGDSWGSPGYSIRSEYNKRPYLRGTVGMASAGKDTEGCQFFITHSEQPQLDGRYTVFGQVTSGMDVVDSIQEGDVIELVSIQR